MVEKWDQSWNSRAFGTPRTSETPGNSEAQGPWEIPFTVWTSEPKHLGTLKLKHIQKTSLAVTNQSRKLRVHFWGFLRGKSTPLPPFASQQLRQYYQQKWQSKTSNWIYLDWKRQSVFLRYSTWKYFKNNRICIYIKVLTNTFINSSN